MIVHTLLVVVGYLVGSLTTAILVCRFLGFPDPRTQGSGNPGATNVLRLGGRRAAAMTLAGDVLKGMLPVLLAKAVTNSAPVIAATALAAFLGHLYPVFFRFQGGKGVATALGAIMALLWPVGIALLTTWLGMAFVFRYSSLSALTAAALAPFYTAYFSSESVYVAAVTVISALAFWRHRSNIRNLLAGTEDRIGVKEKPR